jgi:hypothetical protein
MWQHQPSVNFCEPYEQEHIRRLLVGVLIP